MYLTVNDDRIVIHGSRFDDNPRIRELANARWHPDRKSWSVPATPAVALHMIDLFRGRGVDFDDGWENLAVRAVGIRSVQWAKTAPETNLPAFGFEPIVPPWLHQKRAYWFASALEASMLAMDMGTGKTKAAIDVAVGRRCKAILIACPANVMQVWTREFALHAPDYAILLLDRAWTVAKRLSQAQLFLATMQATRRPAAVIINHEALWRDPFGPWVKSKDAPFDLFVFDESHRGKQHNGQLGGYIKDLWQHIPNRMALTGTPYPHSMLDIFAQFRMLDPGVFGTSWTRFKERYAVMGGFEGKQIVGVQNLEELKAKFEMLAYRVASEDVMDLPDLVETFRTFKLTSEAGKIYKEIEQQFYASLAQGEVIAQNALVKLIRLQQITSGYCRASDDGNPIDVFTGEEKIATLRDLLENELPRPVVVFCRFREDLSRIQELCRQMDLRYGEISGQRSDLTDDAKMPDWCDVLGVQIQAGGLGIDLTRAHVAVFYSVDYRLDTYKQCIKRLHRQGQGQSVLIVHLVAEKTIDEDIYDALTKRQELVDVLLGKKAA